MRKAISTLGVAALALTLGACGGDDDKAAEKILEGVGGEDVDLDIDEDGGSVSIGGEDGGSIDIDTDGDDSGSITFDDGEGGEGTISFGGGEMPEELKNFPLPDDSKVVGTVSGGSGEDNGAIVSVAANGDFDEVAGDVKKGLEDEGMTVSDTFSAEAEGKKTTMFTATGNGRAWTVTIGEDDTSNEGYSLLIGIMTAADTSGM